MFVARNALQLKGQYVGQTSPKVTNAFSAAKGGTLFLDEAYALAGEGRGGDCFSKDAIATLLTESENHRTDVMVILAGYEGPMHRLLDADPGLRRRFPHLLALPDYSARELAAIAEKCARERFDVTLGVGVQDQLAELFGTQKFATEVAHHNASLPIRLVEEALSAMAERTMGDFEAAHSNKEEDSFNEFEEAHGFSEDEADVDYKNPSKKSDKCRSEASSELDLNTLLFKDFVNSI